jgi:protease-4
MDADVIIDRRRLRRRASFWRAVAFLVFASAVIAIVAATSGLGLDGKVRREQVARISVDGFIDTRPRAAELIAEAAEAKAVKAIMVRIDSPGGAAVGGEALYRAIREAVEKKPVVAVIDGLGASAAYMTAIAADHIVARESAVTGSIGVIFQFPHFEELMAKIGVEYSEVKSAPLKGDPSLFREPSPEALAMIQSVVDDTFNWFVGLVAERRNLDEFQARLLADGRIVTGRQALEAKLIDEIGGEPEARDWLASQKDISEDLPVIDWKDSEIPFASFASKSLARIARLLDVDPAFIPAAASLLPKRLVVDGLLMVWQAPAPVGYDRQAGKGLRGPS